MKKSFVFLLLLALPLMCFAEGDLTAFADASMGLLSFTSKVMLAISGSIGLALLGGAYLKYQSYKQNSMQSPLSSVIVLFVLSLMFFGICAIIMHNNQSPEPTIAPVADAREFY